MPKYMISFWSPTGGDYTPPDVTASTVEAAVNKSWKKVPKKYKSGMVRAFATDMDTDDIEPPIQLVMKKTRWKEA